MYIINIALGLVLNHLPEILAWLGSGAVVAIVLQVIKHYGKLQDAKKTVMVLLAVLSFVASYADQAFALASGNGAVLALHNLGWIVTAAIFIHRFAVSPAYYGLLNVVSTYNQNLVDAAAYRQQQAQQAAVATPAPQPEHEFTIPQ